MNIVCLASEATPYAKTGGLADVVGALPSALAKRGHTVWVFLPLYRQVGGIRKLLDSPGSLNPLVNSPVTMTLGGTLYEGAVLHHQRSDGVHFAFVDQPHFFDRAGIYQDGQVDYTDNFERFAFFCHATLQALADAKLAVDCFHIHDWQAALATIFLECDPTFGPSFRSSGRVLTIHNLAFQGIFPLTDLKTAHLPEWLAGAGGIEYYGQINLMKGAILFSDVVTTVSETYAGEIQAFPFGCGLEGVLQQRAGQLIGIVNGIDPDDWNPETDPALIHSYSADNWQLGKPERQARLRAEVGLRDHNAPLAGVVTRLTEQKGVDALINIVPWLMDHNVDVVVLGSGDKTYENNLRQLSDLYAGRFVGVLKHEEALARRIFSACDFFLMPSRFEPCGLAQLYAMRYGAIPIVRAVGGLKDTVCDVCPKNLAAGTATGFQFLAQTPIAFTQAISRALKCHADPLAWQALVDRAMRQDFSWLRRATHYESAYARAGQLARGRVSYGGRS